MSSPEAPTPGAGSSAGMPAAGSSSQLEPPDLMIGQEIGRYRIVRKLGEGGMGEVYAAEHVHISKHVAIKLLRSEIVSNKEAVERFRQEARSASSIGHKNIIQIDDFGELPDGRIFLFMELLAGKPLNDMLKEDSLSPERALNILIQTGHGLAAAHKKGIVHRDMKPENVFVTSDDTGQDVPKLLDFGIAKVSGSDGDNNLTRTGTIFGTPFYMSPEQALGQGVDGRADIYAMGVILYEIFTGTLPFQGESFMGILTQHITAEPTPPSQRAAERGVTLPPGIEPIILQCMEKEPDARYQTMDDLVQALVVVYRRYAGAGMSGYMQAHVPPPTGMHQAASYSGPHGHQAGQMVGQSGPMGQMGGQMATPVPGMPQQGVPTGPHYAAQAGHSQPMSYPYPGDSSLLEVPRRGSKAGVIAAVVILLAVVGGVVGFVVMSGSADTDTPVVVADAGAAADARVIVAVVDASAPEPKTDAAVAPPPVDAAVPKPPPVKLVNVAITSKPSGALVYDSKGDPVGTTPYVLKTPKGKTVVFTLKRDNFKDEEVRVDGSKKEIKTRLTRVRRPRPDGPDRPDRPDPPKRDAGAGSLGIPLE